MPVMPVPVPVPVDPVSFAPPSEPFEGFVRSEPELLSPHPVAKNQIKLLAPTGRITSFIIQRA